MRILEVRDGFIKFEATKKISLSSFVQINDTKNSYIAQVIRVNRAGENSIGYAKILFLYNGAFNDYDKTLPSIDSEITEFDITLFNETFKSKSSVVTGCFIENNELLFMDKDCFDKKMLVCIDSQKINQTITLNLAKQFDNSLIIDSLGIFDTNKFVAGVDFKLPLNTDALEFMFEDCLNDATSDSKSLIKEIFQDLAEYSKTVPFVPFGALKTIVDEMVEKSHVFKLLVLKNKLAKFDRLGYFAATVDEAENLNKILASKNAIIDLSKLDPTFQNRYLSIILSTLKKQNLKPQVFVEASNAISKKNLKTILMGDLSTTLISHSKFKYINEIKSMFTNFIIEPSFSANQVFKTYAMLLNAMEKDSYLLVGDGTRFIPLVSSVVEIMDIPEAKDGVEEFSEDLKTECVIEEADEESVQTQYSELELALEQEEVLETESIKDSASIDAIEKKSEDLIERVSEEVQAETLPTGLNLFAEEDSEIETGDEDLVVENLEEELTEEAIENSSELPNDVENFTEIESAEENSQEAESLEPVAVEVEELVESDDNIGLTESDLEETEEIIEEPVIEEFHTQVDDIQTIEVPEDISDLTEEAESPDIEEISEIEQTELTETANEPETIAEESEIGEIQLRDYSENLDAQEIPDITPITDAEEDFDEIIELDESEIGDADIVVDFEDEVIENLETDTLDKEIVEDVDKVFTTIKEDSISDSDLDFIDELNGSIEEDELEEITLSEGMEELTELNEVEEDEDEGFIEPIEEASGFIEETPEQREILEKRDTSTPIVPVYGAEIPAEDLVISDPIEQGDTVVHAKYGNGVVEKMIKYGTKTLYSINFDNVGRRLLDPTLTEIKKS